MTDDQRAIVDALSDSLDDGFTIMPETVALCEGIEVIGKALGACTAHISYLIGQVNVPSLA